LQTLALHTNARAFERGAHALLAAGAKINATDVFGESVLHKIAACKSLDLTAKCKYLCDHGADINLKNVDGETPRGVLAHVRRKMASNRRLDLKEEIEILDRAFLERGGSLCERDPSAARLQRVAYPVHNVIMSSRWDMIPKIMTHAAGHCAMAADLNGRTPLMAMAAASWSSKNAATMDAFFDWLVGQSNDVEARDYTGRSVAHYACLATGEDAQQGTFAALARLPRVVDLGAVDGLGRLPLHAAASVGNVAAIEWLIKKGQKVDIPDAFGNLPIHLAAQARQDGAYDALGALGAARDRRNDVGISAEEVRARKEDAVRVRARPRSAESESPREAARGSRQGGPLIVVGIMLFVLVAVSAGLLAFVPRIRDALQQLMGS
jgi:ankyrin repeat protein